MKNNKLFLLFISLCLFISFSFKSYNVEENCSILHNGTFKYGDSRFTGVIKIKKNKHTEHHNNGKYVIKSDLEWVNECEYNATITKVTVPNFPYKVGDKMNVKIIKVVGNQVYTLSTVEDKNWEGLLVKIK